MKFKRILREITGFFFPDICMSCGCITESGEKLCGNCRKNLTYTDKNKRCPACGLEKPDCDCKRHIFYFEGAVSTFFNSGSARNIVYRYKLGTKSFYYKFIANEMAKSLESELSDKQFDFLVPVPTSYRSSIGKGFDHTELLAREISKITGIPLNKNIIGVKPNKRSQHKNNYKERFESVKGKYYVKKKAECDCVLLIDDIKTTGATLNACARELLFAGAKSVYCLTALGSERKSERKTNKSG